MTFPTVTRDDLRLRTLIWFEPRDRATGTRQGVGIWTGAEPETFRIDGRDRLYHGGGNVLDLPSLKAQVGTVMQQQKLVISALTPEEQSMTRGLDLRQAAVQIHLARFDPQTGALVAGDRVFSGSVDQAPESIGGGEQSKVDLTLVSTARNLSRKVPLYKSEAAGAARGDSFFRWADVSGKVQTFWNRKRVS
jgi:hypothetical protein